MLVNLLSMFFNRQLNFPRAVCTLPYSTRPSRFGTWPENGMIWITDVLCDGTEPSLNQCTFRGYDVDCRNGPAQALCQACE